MYNAYFWYALFYWLLLAERPGEPLNFLKFPSIPFKIFFFSFSILFSLLFHYCMWFPVFGYQEKPLIQAQDAGEMLGFTAYRTVSSFKSRIAYKR